MSQSSKTITVNILTIAIIETFSLLQSRIAIFLKYRADLILNFSRGVALAACIIKKQYIYRFRRKLVCLPKLVFFHGSESDWESKGHLLTAKYVHFP
jgi:hypothetical protein